MDRFSSMSLFARVVETQSFSAAARESGISQPTVSKQVAELEARLGARLLSRSTRRIGVTEIGAAFYERCKRILAELDEAEQAAAQMQASPAGLLRAGTPVAFGRLHVLPLVPAFLERYPKLKLDLVMNDRFIDLVEEGVDLAIRVGKLSDMSLIARHLGHSRRVTVATPGYLKRHGTPHALEELREHNCIVYSGLTTIDEWHFEGPGGPVQIRVAGNFRANNSEAIREMLLAGIGISVVPFWLVHDEIRRGVLTTLLRAHEPLAMDISALYVPTPHVASKVRCFVDYLAAEFRRNGCLS